LAAHCWFTVLIISFFIDYGVGKKALPTLLVYYLSFAGNGFGWDFRG
jgi:hypothetical protein